MSDFKPIGGTVRSRAAHELRDRVLTGRLRPGDRLDLDEITEEFGISRTPVREALLELSYEGLVTVTPRSGITVIGITPEDAVDNFAVLAALAGKAAEWATTGSPRPSWTNCTVWPTPWTRTGRGRRQPSLPSRRQPRRRVAPAADLPPPGRAGGPGSYFALFPEQGRRSRTEHAALLDAIARGDGAGPRTIAEAHVLDAGAALGDWMRANAVPTGRRPPSCSPGRTARAPTGSQARSAATARSARFRKPSSFSSGVRTRVLRDMADTS